MEMIIYRTGIIGFFVFAILGLCGSTCAEAAGKDEAIHAAALNEGPSAIATVKTLAAIESESSDSVGLAKMADALAARLQTLGFAVTRHKPAAGGGADTVIGTKSGNGSQKIILMAHMDTVFERGTLQTMPVRQDGNRLYGPGVVDAKGGIAVILHTMKVLNDLGWSDFASLTILFNPDEETGSAGSSALITDLASRADTVLSFEVGGDGTRGMAWVLLGTAAYAQVRLEVTGKASHAGTAPALGKNAVLELAHQLLQTKDTDAAVPGSQLSWTKVITDNAFNQIPEKAVAIGDARITVDGAEKDLLAALEAKVASSQLIPGTTAKVSVEILRPGFESNEKARAIAALTQEIDGEFGARSFYVVPMVKGATDAGYAAVSGKAAVLEGFGPSGANLHSRDEYVEIDSFPASIYQVARLLMELGRSSAK
jgi:glutamate carboxypeptidase